MIWATVCSRSCFWWLYRASPYLLSNYKERKVGRKVWWKKGNEGGSLGKALWLTGLKWQWGAFHFLKIFFISFPQLWENDEFIQRQSITSFKTQIGEGNGTPFQYSFAWKTPWMEEPGGLQSMASLRVGHDWATSLSLFTFMHWRRKWQPTPMFLPGESQGRGSLAGCRLWGRTESDTPEAT